METIPTLDSQNNFQKIIKSVPESQSQKPVWISDQGKLLVKISPVSPEKNRSWLGCMKGEGRILGDMVSPAESQEAFFISPDGKSIGGHS